MKSLRTKERVERIAAFIEQLSNRIWEPFKKDEDGFPEETPANQIYKDHKGDDVLKLWEVVGKSSEVFKGIILRNSNLLPNERVIAIAPIGQDIAAKNIGWQTFEFDSIINIAASNSITSVSDATVKTSAYLSTISAAAPGSSRYLFRGQSNIAYELKSRLGRVLADKIADGNAVAPVNPLKVTPEELESFELFKNAWNNTIDKDALSELIAKEYDDEHIGWWVLMQHFAEVSGKGTRMLDVTSNLLVALFFACVGWNDGLVDEDNDGVLYFFMEGHGCVVDDFVERKMPKHSDLFNASHNIPCMIFNPPHNERSKAQGGAFIWWPKFWEQPETGVSYLRIPKEHKLSIAKELLSFGIGPKEIVRGNEGLQCEKNLITQIKDRGI